MANPGNRFLDFARRLALMKAEAIGLGLLRTGHAFDRPVEKTADGEPAGPLYLVGYEIADIVSGKQHLPDFDGIRDRRREYRRKVERRAPKRGVTIRHDDAGYIPKRVRRGGGK